jgi:hypothetical protein
MKYPQIVIHKGNKGGWSLTIDGIPIPFVTEVQFSRTAAGFPQVTIAMIGELFQEDTPAKPGEHLSGFELSMWAEGL